MNADLLEREISRLRKQYEARPQGRAFAPLADGYRKLGRLDEAIELCHEGIGYHPNYSSAHVILGKIHLDRNDLEEARAAFETVLSLDPDNLVALRHLAIDATFREDHSRAHDFWSRVLSMDPFDEEAEAEAERLSALQVTEEVAPAETSEDAPEATATTEAVDSPDDVELDSERAEPTDDPETADADDAMQAGESDEIDEVVEVVENQAAEEALETSEAGETPRVEEEERSEEPTLTVDSDAVAESDEAQDDTAAQDDPLAESDEVQDDVAMETGQSDDLQDGEPFPQLDVFVEDDDPGEALEQVETEPTEAPAAEVISAPEDGTGDETAPNEPTQAMTGTVAGTDLQTGIPGASDFATMTLADIYFEQGFQGKALEMYKSVYQRSPRTEGLQHKIASIEAELSGAAVVPEEAAPTPAAESAEELQPEASREESPSPTNGDSRDDLPSTEPVEDAESQTFDHFRNWLNERTPRR